MQQPLMAAQTVLPIPDVATGSSLMIFAQLLGGAVSISVGQNIFTNGLVSGLESVTNVDVSNVINTGVTILGDIVHDPESLRRVLTVYNRSLVDVYRVALGLACASIIGALTMEWKSMKEKQEVRRR